MPQSSSAAPGWYPDGSGADRYWDGTTWTDQVTDVPGDSKKSEKRTKRRIPRWAMSTLTGLLGLFLGVGIGLGDSSYADLADTRETLETTTTELDSQSALLVTAQDALKASEERVAELELAETENAAAVVATTELAAAQVTRTGELDTREAELATREAALVTGEAGLVTREAELVTREATATERETAVTGREDAVTVREAAAQAPAPAAQNYSAPAPFVAAPPAAAPAAPTSTYYKNCSAVRAAGADPVRRGDPGYGSHLDRDGDGVGCE